MEQATDVHGYARMEVEPVVTMPWTGDHHPSPCNEHYPWISVHIRGPTTVRRQADHIP